MPISTQAHWVRPNETTRVPRCTLYLDTEATITKDEGAEVQSFRLGVVAHDCQPRKGRPSRPREWAGFDDARALWEWVAARTTKRHRTILVAHNLAYDLRLSGAFLHLPAMGWALKAVRLDGGQAWAVWRRDQATLTMVDMVAWLPAPLERVATLMGRRKPELPADPADVDALARRCVMDVAILAEAWRRLMTWLERDDLGVWKPTGAGQSWAAFRHRFYTHRLLVHDDERAREVERRAAWTGRCEAWSHGRLSGGPYTEWDMPAAYARVAQSCEVPTRLVGHLSRVPRGDWRTMARKRAVLASVTVSTDVPVVPALVEGGITWPTGTFDTILWDTELELAESAGADLKVNEAWCYMRAPALQAWADWCLDIIDAPDGDVDPIERLAVKHWSRALIGRFGARWSSWEEWGDAPFTDVMLGTCNDVAAGETFRLLHLGRQMMRDTAECDSPDAIPQVMSWVMAECRRRLWEVACVAGLDHVVYLDTDAVISDAIGSERLEAARPYGVRIKGEWQAIEVLGPRQLVLGRELRAAGVPRGAERVGSDSWRAEVWQGLASSLASRSPSTVTVAERTVQLRGRDRRRQHLEGGLTAPWRLPLAEGVTTVPPPPEVRTAVRV